jgi:cytochrome P450
LTATYNPLDPEHRRDPYPRYHALRAEDPVHWSDLFQGWVLTRHADVVAVLRAPHFSVDRTRTNLIRNAPIPPVREEHRKLAEALKRVLVFLDPPDHTRIRALVSDAFTNEMVKKRRGRIQKIVDELLDEAARREEMDWIKEFAYPLPVTVIAEVLGVPPEERALFKRWSDNLGALLDPFVAPDVLDQAMRSASDMHAFFLEVFEDRRARPRDDLVSALVAAERGGDKLSKWELYATCVVLLGGGHLTTTNLLGNAVWALAQNPEERRRLQAHPELIRTAVDEFLRYDCPVQVTARVATEAHRIDGKTLAEGDLVILVLGAANRDPAVFRDPDRLDISRQENRHVAFGQGIHHCLGRLLARSEIEIAISTLLRRFPDFVVTCEVPERKQTVVSRGLASLPLALREGVI